MENLPVHISTVFLITVAATCGFFYFGIHKSSRDPKSLTTTTIATFLVIWLFLTTLLTFYDFFSDFYSRPPRLLLFAMLPLIFLISVLASKNGRSFIHRIPLTTLTYIHIVRIPVEVVLWWLYQEEVVASAMTFEGNNYDILTGISAPFAGLFLVGMRSKSKIGAVIWNLLALGMLLYILVTSIAATPYFYNQEIFDFPNIAVFHFPFIWLPCFIVPVLFGCHVFSIYKLSSEEIN